MAHSAHTTKELERFLTHVVGMNLPELAKQYAAASEELREVDGEGAVHAARALLNAIGAIGFVKFPREWEVALRTVLTAPTPATNSNPS